MNKSFLAGAILALSAAASMPASAWTISQNFDDSANGASCGWNDSAGSTVNSTVAYSGTKACRLSITAGTSGFGTWGGTIPHPSAVKRGDQMWIRLRTYMPAGFNYDSPGEGNHLKFLRIHTRSPTNSNLGYDDIYINPKGEMPPFRFIYEGEQLWSQIGTSANVIALGNWETYEFYVKFDTAPVSKGGQARVRFWKNGALLADITDRMTLYSADAYSDATYLFTYWNGGSLLTQQMYVDDLVITTDTPSAKDVSGNAYVGLGAAAKTPNAPASVSVD